MQWTWFLDGRGEITRHVCVAVALILMVGVALPAEAKRGKGAHAPGHVKKLKRQPAASHPGKGHGKPDHVAKPSASGAVPTPKGANGSSGVKQGRQGTGKPLSTAPTTVAAVPVQTGGTTQPRDAAARRRARRRAAARREAVARRRAAARRRATARRVAPTLRRTAPAAGAAVAAAGAPSVADPTPAGDGGSDRGETAGGTSQRGDGGPVVRTVRDVVDRVPEELKAALAALAALSLILGCAYFFAAMRARRLARQRRELLQEVGLLQEALLPPVPEIVGAVSASVAYRPADGPAAGGDFYDAMALPCGRAAFILGDVSGHGRAALAHTAFMRYTLRAYLEAGLEPRMALQVAERAVGGQLNGDFATVIVAVHDPSDGSLTYACAGHPAPIVAGAAKHDPVHVGWSPPIGWGLPTGTRQTTVPLPSGAMACLYTDGVADTTTAEGPLGREGLAEIVASCGRDATAQMVIDAVSQRSTKVRDDMAACLIAPVPHVTAGTFRTELLELTLAELEEGLGAQFMRACSVAEAALEPAEQEAIRVAAEHNSALLVARFGIRGSRVQVLPRTADTIQSAALQRSSAARR